MNNIQEKDWAEDSWCGHTGMDSESDYCFSTGAQQTTDEEKQQGKPAEKILDKSGSEK